jgi:hypothetical protein
MNIVTVPYNSDFYYIRPDISLNRDSNDYFCPDEITEITVAPFVYIRMDKAGKAISFKFAGRYCSQIGYGVNLTAQSLVNKDYPMSFLTANSLDNTTYVSKLYLPQEFPADLLKNNNLQENIFLDFNATELIERFYKQIEKITRLTSVRTGDLIILELAEPVPVKIGSNIKLGELSFSIK